MIVREEFQNKIIRDVNVRGFSGERNPAERTASFAEQRTDEQRHEAADLERVLHARLQRLAAQVVAVVERDRAAPL